MKIRKLGDKKPKILLVQGSPRKLNSCANQTSKSERIMNYVLEKWSPFIDFEIVDLGVGKITVQPCKGCVSTSNGLHCHWKCDCYSKGSKTKPDLMYEDEVYDKLERCDAFIVISPIHWYSVSTQVKAMFDRLVCANLTITSEEAVQLFGQGNTKNSDITGNAEISGKYKSMLKNHLSGKYAAFYVHGDDGAADYNGNSPITGDGEWNVKNNVMPLVYQCRYSEINCPDDLIECFYINRGIEYYKANLEMDDNSEFFDRMDSLIERLLNYL